MKEQIEKLEAQLKELKKVYEDKQRIKYEASEHKSFKNGDIVTNGNIVAIVEWIENKLIGCQYEKGYFGGSIVNGNRGSGVFKRDEFELVADEYYKKEHQILISLTGLEIEEIKYYLKNKNFNSNDTKSNILNCLDAVHQTKNQF